MPGHPPKLTIYYDGACPICIRDRQHYQKLAGTNARYIEWLDINGRDAELRQQGIDPAAALRELHVRDEHGDIHREMDAYILLFSRIIWLKPLAWLVSLPGLKPLLSCCYRHWVKRRLKKQGRW